MKTVVLVYYGEIIDHQHGNVGGVAAYGRLMNIAELFRRSNCSVHILALGDSSPGEVHPGIYIHAVPNKMKAQKNKYKAFVAFINQGKDFMSILQPIHDERHVDTLFYVSAFTNVVLPVSRYSRKEGISLGVVANDWYEWTAQKLIYALNTQIAWCFLYPRYKYFISTSRFLNNYFNGRGRVGIRIPAIFPAGQLFEQQLPMCEDDKITIVYAGDARNSKDFLNRVVLALNMLSKTEREKIILSIAGTTKDTLRATLGRKAHIVDELEEQINFVGYLNQNKIRAFYQSADFSILIRPMKRYAIAGFSTKFAESMSYGIPVIANLTSDYVLYLRDSENGIVVVDDKVESIAHALRRVISLNSEEIAEMKKRAFESAELHFCLESHQNAFQDFVDLMSGGSVDV